MKLIQNKHPDEWYFTLLMTELINQGFVTLFQTTSHWLDDTCYIIIQGPWEPFA